MSFTPEPMLPGDLYEAGARLARVTSETLLKLPDPAARVDAEARLWRDVIGLGWPALALPEAGGGAGGTLEDVAALVEGAASDAMPLPVASICGLVPALLAGTDPVALTESIADGTSRLVPVLDAYQGWSPAPDRPRASGGRVGGTIVLAGVARGVETLADPTAYLLACPLDSPAGIEPALILVPAPALLAPRRFERIDGRLTADLAFAGLELPAEALLARGPLVGERVRKALELGAVLTCVEVVSALGAALQRVITYLSERSQFGAALSSLQALRHRVAEIYISYETLKAMVQRLLRVWPQGGASRDAALAKLYVGRAARRAAEAIIQLHGGMGMTQELPATRLNKRLLMAEFDFGDAAWHARQLLRAA